MNDRFPIASFDIKTTGTSSPMPFFASIAVSSGVGSCIKSTSFCTIPPEKISAYSCFLIGASNKEYCSFAQTSSNFIQDHSKFFDYVALALKKVSMACPNGILVYGKDFIISSFVNPFLRVDPTRAEKIKDFFQSINLIDFHRACGRLFSEDVLGRNTINSSFVASSGDDVDYRTAFDNSFPENLCKNSERMICTFRNICKTNNISTIGEFEALVSKPIAVEKFGFGKHKGELIIDVIKNDQQYIKWFLGNSKFESEAPDVYASVRAKFEEHCIKEVQQ